MIQAKGHNHGVIGRPPHFWNVANAGTRKLQNARMADNTQSDVSVEVSENDGQWGIDNQSGSFHGYIYHNCQCVDLSITLRYLPAGTYHVYVYAQGDAPNQNAAVEIESSNVIHYGKKTLNDGTWKFRSPVMENGNQFVRYTVNVDAGSPMIITSKSDGSRYSMLNTIPRHRLN